MKGHGLLRSQMRQTDPRVVTALTHQPWRLSHFRDGTPRNLSRWGHMCSAVLDVLLDWAHHHVLWRLCGISAILVHKDSISVWVKFLNFLPFFFFFLLYGPVFFPLSLLIRDYVQFWAKRGVEVVGWTVNTAVEKDFYQNVLKTGYITDSLLEDCEPHY